MGDVRSRWSRVLGAGDRVRAYLGLLGKLQPGHYERYVVFLFGLGEERCVMCRVVMLLLLVGYLRWRRYSNSTFDAKPSQKQQLYMTARLPEHDHCTAKHNSV